jgi:excisionase family DNA binding protein
MTEMQERMEAAAVEWARRVPVDQIPPILAFLSARPLAESHSSRSCVHNGESARHAENLLTAGELAERLNLPESWVRSEERAGRIASVRLGKYVRFRLSDVERDLAERRNERPKLRAFFPT